MCQRRQNSDTLLAMSALSKFLAWRKPSVGEQRDRRVGTAAGQGLLEGSQEEVGVLEVAQQAEVGGDADADQHAPPAPRREPLDAVGEAIVEDGGDEDEAGQVGVPAGVEVEA